MSDITTIIIGGLLVLITITALVAITVYWLRHHRASLPIKL